MTTSSLLEAIRAESAALEALKARRGILTPVRLRSLLPEWLARQCSPALIADLTASINDALSEPTQVIHHDPKSKAAGE